MLNRFVRRQGWAFAAAIAVAAVLVPAAWAVGWTGVGAAGVKLNEQTNKNVITSSPVYSSEMRLYVSTHSPCGGQNFYEAYAYPDGSLYAESALEEICTAAETPTYWNVSGGNKYALCGEAVNEPTDPTSTCQRYSTT